MAQSRLTILPNAKTERRVEHGFFDADIFEKIDPAVGADFVERAGRKVVHVGGVQMVEGRKGIEKWMGVVLIAIGLRHVVDDRFGVLDHVAVAVDNRVAFVLAWKVPPGGSVERLSHQAGGALSRPVRSSRLSLRVPSYPKPEPETECITSCWHRTICIELIVGAVLFELE